MPKIFEEVSALNLALGKTDSSGLGTRDRILLGEMVGSKWLSSAEEFALNLERPSFLKRGCGKLLLFIPGVSCFRRSTLLNKYWRLFKGTPSEAKLSELR